MSPVRVIFLSEWDIVPSEGEVKTARMVADDQTDIVAIRGKLRKRPVYREYGSF
jgi:hypothetical protein